MNTHTQTHTRLIDTYSSIYFKMHSPASQPTYTWYGGAGGPGYRPVEDRGRQSRSLRWSSWSWERDRFCRESNMAKRHTQMSKKNSVKGSWTLFCSSCIRLRPWPGVLRVCSDRLEEIWLVWTTHLTNLCGPSIKADALKNCVSWSFLIFSISVTPYPQVCPQVP